jgi:hypothetical protein
MGYMLALDVLLAAFFLDAGRSCRASGEHGEFRHGKADGF